MNKAFKYIINIAIILGVGLSFYAILETIRAYQTLSEMHPWAGYAFLAFIFLLVLYLIIQISALFKFNSAPRPPVIPEDGTLSNKQKRYIQTYLNYVYERFNRNKLLTQNHEKDLSQLEKSIAILSEVEDSSFINNIHAIENDIISKILKTLDEKAEKVVSDNVGLVSIGTALSPYRAVDFYIVIARNFRMVNQILKIYRTRPNIRETWKVFYDIIKVVAAVNILNSMDTVWAGIGRHVPLVGRYGEAASEGLFSGLFTSVAGHAAIDRCRSYHPWSTEEAARKYRGRLTRWAKDILAILKNHGLEMINLPKIGKKQKDVIEKN